MVDDGNDGTMTLLLRLEDARVDMERDIKKLTVMERATGIEPTPYKLRKLLIKNKLNQGRCFVVVLRRSTSPER